MGPVAQKTCGKGFVQVGMIGDGDFYKAPRKILAIEIVGKDLSNYSLHIHQPAFVTLCPVP